VAKRKKHKCICKNKKVVLVGDSLADIAVQIHEILSKLEVKPKTDTKL
jgi:hypothetical protein